MTVTPSMCRVRKMACKLHHVYATTYIHYIYIIYVCVCHIKKLTCIQDQISFGGDLPPWWNADLLTPTCHAFCSRCVKHYVSWMAMLLLIPGLRRNSNREIFNVQCSSLMSRHDKTCVEFLKVYTCVKIKHVYAHVCSKQHYTTHVRVNVCIEHAQICRWRFKEKLWR